MLLDIHKLFKADMNAQMLKHSTDTDAHTSHAKRAQATSFADPPATTTRRPATAEFSTPLSHKDSSRLADVSTYYETLVAAIVEKGVRPAGSAEVGMEVLWSSSQGRQLRVVEELREAHAAPTVRLVCLLAEAYRRAGQFKRVLAICETLAPESAPERLKEVPLATLRLFADAMREDGASRRLAEIHEAIGVAEAVAAQSDLRRARPRDNAAEQLDIARALEGVGDVSFHNHVQFSA